MKMEWEPTRQAENDMADLLAVNKGAKEIVPIFTALVLKRFSLFDDNCLPKIR